jgi:hypothetical protein
VGQTVFAGCGLQGPLGALRPAKEQPGITVGLDVVGLFVGVVVGFAVGESVGTVVGTYVTPASVGAILGLAVGKVGDREGKLVGIKVGDREGKVVGMFVVGLGVGQATV